MTDREPQPPKGRRPKPEQPGLGGVIHTYQKYDPRNFPSPTAPPPDVVSSVFDHLLMYGGLRELTDEELARAVQIDPSQIAGLGPSIDALIALLLERKRKILATYETGSVVRRAQQEYRRAADAVEAPRRLAKRFRAAIRDEQLYELERLWYAVGDDNDAFSQSVMHVIAHLGNKYEIDELASKYEFTGREPMTIPQALEIKEELERIDELLKQLEEASQTGRIALIDLDALRDYTEPGDMERLRELQRLAEDYLREAARRQGLEHDGRGYQLTPKAYRVFQGKLLERIFSELEASRSGRHQGPVAGEGAVEMIETKPYEFGDPLAHLDLPQSMINALIRQGPGLPIRMSSGDLVVHRTRNTPKCATVVVMDLSGSTRYDGIYVHVKRMALALQGLIIREYPGDFLRFVEMATFARPVAPAEIVELMPKPVTIFDPVVRLKVDMSRDDVNSVLLPPHFTNIQHGLEQARRLLVNQDSPNRQVILITDGLPTAHFEQPWLYLLYPPDPLTEAATMREALLCQREGITINIFLLSSWSQSEEDVRFAYRVAESTRGRVFFTAGKNLDRYVVWDYVRRKREIVG